MDTLILNKLEYIEKIISGKMSTQWLNIRELAIWSKCSQSTIRREIQKGHLKSYNRTGGKLLFLVTDAEKWLKG